MIIMAMDPLIHINSLKQLKNQYNSQLPKHLGLILDGNRRWAQLHGISDPTQGHLAGYQTLKKILLPIFNAGIHYLTVYALSLDNVQKRPAKEVQFLFQLLLKGVADILKEDLIYKNKVRVRLIGRIWELPLEIQAEITKLNKITEQFRDNFINFCVMYDGQEELVDAVKNIITDKIAPDQITKEILKTHLYTREFPECDYVIRTGMNDGMRLSGFLLWDIAYAEFRFRNELWPDYNAEFLLDDLKEFITRHRRKGA
jgi:tritrans,polycis-undecaprenyl-diphosphate synthase [geranylgeranyl-diphosphate specific]